MKQLGRAYLEGREKLIASEESTWRERASAVHTGTTEPSEPTAAASPTEGNGTLRPSALPLLPERPRAREDRAIVAALVVVSGLLAGILGILVHPPAEPVAPAAATSPVEPPATVAPPAPAAPPASAPPPAASAAPPDAGPTPRLLTSARLRLLAPPPASALPAPRAAPAPPAATAGDCNPPFYFDGKKKVYKPDCVL